MKTNLIFSFIVLGLSAFNSAYAFQEKFLVRSMGQRNFSSSLMTSTMEVARDLQDKTGCLHKTSLNPDTNKFVICDLNELNNKSSRCHLINLKNNNVEASGPVAFGKKGVTHIDANADSKAQKTLLGAFITKNELNKKSSEYSRQLVRANGSMLDENLSPVFKPESRRVPASTKGGPTTAGDFANLLKNESANLIWVNHSVKHPYDNACGMAISRNTYESDMSETQLAEHRAKTKKNEPQRGIASEKKSSPKRGIASEKDKK